MTNITLKLLSLAVALHRKALFSVLAKARRACNAAAYLSQEAQREADRLHLIAGDKAVTLKATVTAVNAELAKLPKL